MKNFVKWTLLLVLCLPYILPACKSSKAGESGPYVDIRDSQQYEEIKIGGQVWMARNMNFKTEGGSWCYNDNAANCEKYGRLYTWSAAKKACPEGWHLPSQAEWDQLDAALGMSAGKKIKSASGWRDGGGGDGSTAFNALPGGDRYDYGGYGGQGDEAYFWTADAAVDKECYGRFLTYNSGDIQRGVWFRGGGNAVRCIKDPE